MNEDYSSSYIIDDDVPECSRQIVPVRRGPLEPLPLVSAREARGIQRELFLKYGLEKYASCATCEMPSRPIPHAFRVEKTAPLTALYLKWLPLIFERVMPEIVAPVQSYNKISRMGWPILGVPEDKQPYLEEHFSEIASSGTKSYKDSFVVIGIRLQAEPEDKERDFLFLTDHGVEERTIRKIDKTVDTTLLGPVIASRTRNVFNLPVPNLYKQVLDTAIHNVYLSYPLFHHDLYSAQYTGEGRAYFALDVKHFERYTATAARARGALLGGQYSDITTLFSEIPFLVPHADWKKFSFVTPNRKAGWSEQFASGDSGVTTVQKEVFLALYSEYFATTRRLASSDAIQLALSGGDDKLTILNYGDDNFFFGDPEEIKAVFKYLGEYLAVEEEQPPKFLGFIFKDDGKRKFELGVPSYLLKTYLPERGVGTQFRKYPCYGWMMKRTTYEKYGDHILPLSVFPDENKLLEQLRPEVRWSDVVSTALVEQRSIGTSSSVYRDPRVAVDKTYLLTEKEKIASGIFFGFMPDKTAPMIKQLLGDQWKTKLRL